MPSLIRQKHLDRFPVVRARSVEQLQHVYASVYASPRIETEADSGTFSASLMGANLYAAIDTKLQMEAGSGPGRLPLGAITKRSRPGRRSVTPMNGLNLCRSFAKDGPWTERQSLTMDFNSQ
jgi:hypothetical protein